MSRPRDTRTKQLQVPHECKTKARDTAQSNARFESGQGTRGGYVLKAKFHRHASLPCEWNNAVPFSLKQRWLQFGTTLERVSWFSHGVPSLSTHSAHTPPQACLSLQGMLAAVTPTMKLEPATARMKERSPTSTSGQVRISFKCFQNRYIG